MVLDDGPWLLLSTYMRCIHVNQFYCVPTVVRRERLLQQVFELRILDESGVKKRLLLFKKCFSGPVMVSTELQV